MSAVGVLPSGPPPVPTMRTGDLLSSKPADRHRPHGTRLLRWRAGSCGTPRGRPRASPPPY